MLSFFPRGVLDEILNLIESVSEGFPSYSFRTAREIHVLNMKCVSFDHCVKQLCVWIFMQESIFII